MPQRQRSPVRHRVAAAGHAQRIEHQALRHPGEGPSSRLLHQQLRDRVATTRVSHLPAGHSGYAQGGASWRGLLAAAVPRHARAVSRWGRLQSGWTPGLWWELGLPRTRRRELCLLPGRGGGRPPFAGGCARGPGRREIGGTALECPLEEFEIRVRLHKRPRMVAPLARTRSSWLTFGFGDTFEAAAAAAAGRCST